MHWAVKFLWDAAFTLSFAPGRCGRQLKIKSSKGKVSVLPAVPPIYDEMISWQLLCPQGCLPQLPQGQNENLGTKTRTEVKAVSAYSKRGPWGLQELRLPCWAGSCVKAAAKAMLCVTPDPGTCRKPVLLPHFSKVALTCDLGDFYCLDWGVGAIYSCLLRSYSLLGQVCPLLMSVLTSRASNFLACLPQPLQSPACFYIINKSVFFCLERKRAEGFLNQIG